MESNDPNVVCGRCSYVNPPASRACTKCGVAFHGYVPIEQKIPTLNVQENRNTNRKIWIGLIGLIALALIAYFVFGTSTFRSKSWIGGTKARLIEQFGNPVETTKDEKGNEILKFKTAAYSIEAMFKKDVCIKLGFQKPSYFWSEDETSYLLSQNGDGYKWEGNYRDYGVIYQEEWYRSDGKVRVLLTIDLMKKKSRDSLEFR